ncbi:acyltransferase [Sphingomonas sp. KR1UV-12]|uniref:Acyltransferase n=1 Tax=Sphingomonas aurea TaxID=3063994 RepID=A0ABT9EIM6_9SPHN|nr:acyltransferase [Sphingomonas sp. KR1UV-12]MDP1026692.1 acyltransferase [Sphingomonas sp. KR1UV-12]
MIANLQLLRALAAMLVVLFHAREIAPDVAEYPLFRGGMCGVDIFFVLSGFVMVYTTERPDQARRFLLRRMLRVAPPYYLIVLVAALLWMLSPGLFRSTVIDPESLTKTLAFVPYVKSDARIYPILFVGWTLNYEMFFYAVFAVAMLVSHRYRAMVAGIAIAVLTLGELAVSGLEYGPVAYVLTRSIMLDFVLGMAVGRGHGAIVRLAGRTGGWPFGLLFAAGAGLLALAATADWPAAAIVPDTSGFFRFGLFAAMMVAGVVGLDAAGHRIRNRLALQVGDASYALYLLHPFVVILGVKVADRLDLSLPTRLGVIVAAMAIATGLAILFHRRVERPMVAALNRWFVPRPQAAA